MRDFLDTSVLVAAFLGDHPHHGPSAKVFAAAGKRHSSCAAHSLAEAYSTLTRLPVKPAIAPEQAMLFLADVQARLTLVSLDPPEYLEALGRAAEQGVSGGSVYDALLLRCALKARAEVVYTWNTKDFRRLSPEEPTLEIRTP